MPKIIGKSATVVQEGGLLIEELAGNVATSQDTISIASVTISSPTEEPWLTLKYDEWICVTSGCVLINYYEDSEKKQLEVSAGETCFVAKNERFQPEFPIVPTTYIPVCLPEGGSPCSHVSTWSDHHYWSCCVTTFPLLF